MRLGAEGKKGWDNLLTDVYDQVRFVDWLAVCHAELDHCGMCLDCLNPKPVALEVAA